MTWIFIVVLNDESVVNKMTYECSSDFKYVTFGKSKSYRIFVDYLGEEQFKLSVK